MRKSLHYTLNAQLFFILFKIIYVGCGCCHTAVLTQSGFVYVCGNNSFGQIGDLTRQKTNIPLKVELGNIPVTKITVGYFHTVSHYFINHIKYYFDSK